MATTLTIKSKTTFGIALSVTKTLSYSCPVDIGPGNDWSSIVNNKVAESVVTGGAGTYDVSFVNIGLVANTQYGAIAYLMGGGESEISNVVDATLPPPKLASCTATLIGPTGARIEYTTAVDGGYYPKTIEYSKNWGQDWTPVATVTSGAATSGSFDVSGLNTGTNQYLYVRATTLAGADGFTLVTFRTANPSGKIKSYGSVSGFAESLNELYGSSSNQSQRITKLYGPKPVQSLVSVTGTVRTGGSGNVTAFNGTTFLTQAGASLNSVALDHLQIDRDSTGDYDLWVEYSDGTIAQRLVRHGNATEMASYGVTVTPTTVGIDYIDLTPTYNTTYEAKLVHQGFGHLTYS